MSALEHVLQEQAAKLDPTVAEYLNTVIQEFVQSGCIDGEASTVEALYESCSDFLQECDVSADGFKQAVHRLSSGKENSAAVSEENNAAHQNEASAAGASAKAEKENGSRRSEGHSTSSTGNSANAGGGRAPQQQKSGGKRADGSGEDKTEKPGASTQHADHQKTEAGAAISKSEKRKGMQKEASTASGTVLALFKAAALPEADPTILEYIQSVAEDFVATGSKDEEEEEEVRETILGVAPELASFLAEEKNFAFFLGRIRTLSQQKSAEERKQDQPCAQKKRVTEEEEQNAEERLREEEEERKRAEQAAAKRREEEWLKGSEELRVLRDMFPTCAVAELKLRLDVANGDLQEAIERTVEMIEFSEGLVSKEELQAEREAFEAEAREAMRERALTYYSEVKESEKGETGKKVDPRGALHKSADFDREVQRALAAEKVTRRFINNEVVAHKGERFIMEKTRNAVPEDPKSFIGLKIKSKKKGPSPNFK